MPVCSVFQKNSAERRGNIMVNKSGFRVIALPTPPTTPDATVNNPLYVACSIKLCVL